MKKKSDYLNPRWQKFRLRRLEIADWRCEACGSKEDTLHIHHAFYIKGRKLWEYLPDSTIVLCDECHEITHDFASDFNLGAGSWERAASLELHCRLPHSGFRRIK